MCELTVGACVRVWLWSGGGGGVPDSATILRSARMVEPSYRSGLVCILVLITSMGVAYPCERAALMLPATKNRQSPLPVQLVLPPRKRWMALMARLLWSLGWLVRRRSGCSGREAAALVASSRSRLGSMGRRQLENVRAAPLGAAEESPKRGRDQISRSILSFCRALSSGRHAAGTVIMSCEAVSHLVGTSEYLHTVRILP